MRKSNLPQSPKPLEIRRPNLSVLLYCTAGAATLFGLAWILLRMRYGSGYITTHDWIDIVVSAVIPTVFAWTGVYFVIIDPHNRATKRTVVGICSVLYIVLILMAAFNRHSDESEQSAQKLEAANQSACGQAYEEARELDSLSQISSIGMNTISRDVNLRESEAGDKTQSLKSGSSAFSREYGELRQREIELFVSQRHDIERIDNDLRQRLGQSGPSPIETAVNASLGNNQLFSGFVIPGIIAADLRTSSRQLCPALSDPTTPIN